MLYEKTCPGCQQEYKTENKKQIHCSYKCCGVTFSKRMKGKPLAPEHLAKINAKKTRDHVRVEGDFECGMCGKKFDSNTSLRSHKSYCTHRADHPDEDTKCPECEEVFSSHRGMKIHVSIVHCDVFRTDQRAQRIKESKKKSKVRLDSKAEKAFFEKLSNIFSDLERNFVIHDYFHVYDMYVPSLNVLIEFDGDYWHGNSNVYPETKFSEQIKWRRELDHYRTKELIEKGYKVLRLWEKEIKELNLEIFTERLKNV